MKLKAIMAAQQKEIIPEGKSTIPNTKRVTTLKASTQARTKAKRKVHMKPAHTKPKRETTKEGVRVDMVTVMVAATGPMHTD